MRSHRSAGAESDATSPLEACAAVMGLSGPLGMTGVCAVRGGAPVGVEGALSAALSCEGQVVALHV